jgi:tetratricopeptide (TPR) repeat protein
MAIAKQKAKRPPNQPPNQPHAAQITRAQLRRWLGISERQLRAYERRGWIEPAKEASGKDTRSPAEQPSSPSDRQAWYSFAEVSALRSILQLRRSGIPLRMLQSLREALQKNVLPAEPGRIWSDFKIQSQGRRLSVAYLGSRMEPLTGQFLLNFEADRERSKLQSLSSARRNREPSVADRRVQADRLFLAGLRYEERPETISKAIRAYQKATELNPRALGAFINLGTIFYHQGSLGEAERCYLAALALNPRSALVQFNLANLLEEKGQLEPARDHYEQAIRLDPAYPDPHFNLALVYERLSKHGKACEQWRSYLRLDPQSRWAAYARSKLEQIPLRVVTKQ